MAKLTQALTGALAPLLHILNGFLPFNLIEDPNAKPGEAMAGTVATLLFTALWWALNHFAATHVLAAPYLTFGVPALTVALHQWGKPSAVAIDQSKLPAPSG